MSMTSQGIIATMHVKHCLQQYNTAFGSCPFFIFLLFGQLRRHTGLKLLSASVKNNSKAFTDFKALSSDPKIVERIESAIKDPTTADAKALIRQLNKTVSVYGPMVPFTDESRKAKKGHFIAMRRHFGPPTFFNTAADDPIGSPLALRMTWPSINNHDFPATEKVRTEGGTSTFVEQLIREGKISVDIRDPSIYHHRQVDFLLNYATLIERINTNAAAAIYGYCQQMYASFEHIYGIPLTSTSGKRTQHMPMSMKGAFGHVAAVVSVLEGENNLHHHALINAALPAWAFYYAAATPQLHTALAKVLESIVECKLPVEVHAQSLFRRLFGFKPHRGCWYEMKSNDSHGEHTFLSAERVQIHNAHGSRCRKGAFGTTQCSQNVERPLQNATTTFEVLRDNEAGTILLRDVEVRSTGSFRKPLDVGEKPVILTEILRPDLTSEVDIYIKRLLESTDYDDIIMKRFMAQAEHNEMFCTADQELVAIYDRLQLAYDPDDPEDNEAKRMFTKAEICYALDELRESSLLGRLIVGDVMTGVLLAALPRVYFEAFREAAAERNNKVIEFNAVQMGLRGCNTANYFLSVEAAAKVAMFYLLDYLLKNQSDRSATLSIAKHAILTAQRFQSIAPDTGTASRTAQHELSKIMNSFVNQGEITLMRAAAALTGVDAEPSTHTSKPLNVAAAINLAKSSRSLLSQAGAGHGYGDVDDADIDDLDGQKDEDADTDYDDLDEIAETDAGTKEDSNAVANLVREQFRLSLAKQTHSTAGVVRPVKVKGRVIIPDILLAYKIRPEQCRHLCLYEFFSIMSLEKKDRRLRTPKKCAPDVVYGDDNGPAPDGDLMDEDEDAALLDSEED